MDCPCLYVDRFWDRFLEYELFQIIDNKCF